MIESTPVSRDLEALQVPYRLFHHSGKVTSLEQAAQERNQKPEQVVRSIVFRLEQGSYIMVLMAGPDQIDWKALRQHTGRSRLTTASREELLSVTGYEIGAVAPFGLPGPMPVLVDSSVLEQEEISLGSGIRGTAVIMKSSELLRALDNPQIGRFGK